MLARGCVVQRGTLDYMAPELVEVAGCDDDSPRVYPITAAVDVYSFGLVLWQIITGEPLDRLSGALRPPRCASQPMRMDIEQCVSCWTNIRCFTVH